MAAPAIKSGALLKGTANVAPPPARRTTRVFWFLGLTWIIPSGGGVGILADVACVPQRTSKGIPGKLTAPPAGQLPIPAAMAAVH